MDQQQFFEVMGTGTHQQKMDYLLELESIFDSYNRKIAHAEEIIIELLKLIIKIQDDELTDQMMQVVCSAEISQDLQNVNFDILAKNIDKLSEKALPVAIRILNYTYDKKYSSLIQTFTLSKNAKIRDAAQEALKEFDMIN